MSYVTCRYCWKQGHNRRGCPERKADATANPASAAAREERNYKRSQREAIDSRACSYCREKGHTRRTCKIFKSDLGKIINRQTEYRRLFIDEAAEAGLGPGAIVTVARGPQWYGAEDAWKQTVTSIIVETNWESVDFLRSDMPDSHWTASTTFIGRIIKTHGFDADRSSSFWGNCPQPGERTLIGSEDVMFLMEQSHTIYKRKVATREYPQVRVISPSYKKYSLPEPGKSSITNQLNKNFHLFPKTNARPALKERLDFSSLQWRNVDRKAYFEHISEHPGTMERLKQIMIDYEENYGRPF